MATSYRNAPRVTKAEDSSDEGEISKKNMATSYRNAPRVTKAQDSSDEGEISSSENSDSDAADALWSKKRTKPNRPIIQPPISAPRAQSKRSKNANIWGSVLTQQSSNDISSSLGAVGMQYHISRGPESFDLPANINIGRRGHSDSSYSSEDEAPENPVQQQQPKPKGVFGNASTKVTSSSGSRDQRKRKKPKNKNNVPSFKPGQQVTLNRRCELSDTDPVDKVAEELAFRLWERKKDLVRAITEAIGVSTAIDFCNKTEDIEKSGGLMVMNGIRRRTPGGTFLHLIRNDPKLDQDPINKIFALEAEREKMQWEVRKQSKKKTKEEENTHVNNCEMNDLTAEPQVKQSADTQNCNNGQSAQVSPKPLVNAVKPTAELSDGEIMDSEEETETFG